MTSPIIQQGEYGADKTWNLVSGDEFASPVINPSRWYAQTIDDSVPESALHYSGNFGIDRDGNVGDFYAKGKRWAAWYDNYRSQVQYVANGSLFMRGYASDDNDPTAQTTYMDDGVLIDPSKKNYASWLESAAFEYSVADGGHVPADGYPRQYWRYGFFEIEVDFTYVITPGFRMSWWLMPAIDPATGLAIMPQGTTYDGNGVNGCEIDVFEYEYAPDGNIAQALLMKNIFGDGPGDQPVYATDHGIDIRDGPVRIGLLWQKELQVWYINGVEVNRRTTQVPEVYQSMMFTREMNSGVTTDINAPQIQQDYGLWGYNIHHPDNRAKIATDRCEIKYVRVWQDADNADNLISPYNVPPDIPDETYVPPPAEPQPGDPAPVVTIQRIAETDVLYRVHQGDISRSTGTVPCWVEILDNPQSLDIDVLWTATAGSGTVTIDTPTLPSCTVFIDGVDPADSVTIQCQLTIDDNLPDPIGFEIVSITGPYRFI